MWPFKKTISSTLVCPEAQEAINKKEKFKADMREALKLLDEVDKIIEKILKK